jgi:hypothetical protein
MKPPAIYKFEVPLIHDPNFNLAFGTAPFIQPVVGEYGLILARGLTEPYHCFKLLSDIPYSQCQTG